MSIDTMTNEQLRELLRIYAHNWLADDGAWFQAVERRRGMDEAMAVDVDAWRVFTVAEARRLKAFLKLPELGGLEGLSAALSLRFYARINRDEIAIDGNALTYRMTDCYVQRARERKGLPWHPCKAVGVVEYGEFARTIDRRISCECLSCFPDIRDESCCCAWRFTLNTED